MEKYSSRIKEKITDVDKHIAQLEKIIPKTVNEYISNYVVSAACERLAEKIMEDIIKISTVILKEKGINERSDSFQKLNDLGLLTARTTNNLQNFKGLRNLMIHNYDEFDENIFYESLKEIIRDAKSFKKEIIN